MPQLRFGFRPAKPATPATPAKPATATAVKPASIVASAGIHRDWNGRGGFKPGNKYGARAHKNEQVPVHTPPGTPFRLSGGVASRAQSMDFSDRNSIRRAADELRVYRDTNHVSHEDARAHADRIIRQTAPEHLDSALYGAGMSHLVRLPRDQQIDKIRGYHDHTITVRNRRASELANLRQMQRTGMHRSTPESRANEENAFSRMSDRDLRETHEGLARDYQRSLQSGERNAGQRAHMRRRMRAIDAEQKSRTAMAQRQAEAKSRPPATPTTEATVPIPRFSMPKFGMTKNARMTGLTPEIQGKIQKIFGRNMTARQIASMAGAPDHASVNFINNHHSSHSFAVEINKPGMMAERVFRIDSEGKPEIYNAGFFGKGFGVQVFGRQIENAHKLGVTRIKVTAARSASMNGYNTWARFGYQGDIPSHVREMASIHPSPHINQAERVEDLMKTPEGQAWWRHHGAQWSGTFDLARGSASMKAWRGYNKEKHLLAHAPKTTEAS